MLFKIVKRKEQLIIKTGVVDWVNCVKYDCSKYNCLKNDCSKYDCSNCDCSKNSSPKSRPFEIIFATVQLEQRIHIKQLKFEKMTVPQISITV